MSGGVRLPAAGTISAHCQAGRRNGSRYEPADIAAVEANAVAIKAKTDNLPAIPASQGDVTTVGTTATNIYNRIGAPAGASIAADVAVVKADVLAIPTTDNTAAITAIKAKTDNLPAAPASEPNVSAVGAAVVTTNSNVLAVDAAALAIKAKTDNLPASPAAVGSPMTLAANQIPVKKNTALAGFTFPMVVGGVLTPGLTVTVKRSIDGGAPALCANGANDVGGGIYSIDLAASDLNGNMISLIFTAPSAKTQVQGLVTQ